MENFIILGYFSFFFKNLIKKQIKTLKNKITDVYLLIKIKDFKKFDEIFPDNLGDSKVHPYWIYHDKKGVIKINLESDIVNFLNRQKLFEYTIDELLELKENNENLIDIDINTFKPFGDYYIYIDYIFDNKKYTNFYNTSDEILSTQFSYKNSKSFNYKFYDSFIDIKPFLNNDKPITSEHILLYNDTINKNLDNLKIVLIKEELI
jgi:hypothetical protein